MYLHLFSIDAPAASQKTIQHRFVSNVPALNIQRFIRPYHINSISCVGVSFVYDCIRYEKDRAGFWRKEIEAFAEFDFVTISPALSVRKGDHYTWRMVEC